jgi:hypothetical protein
MKNNLGNKSKVLGITFGTKAINGHMDKDKPVYVLGGKNFRHSNLLNFHYERQMLEESAQIIRRHRTKRSHPGKLAYLVHKDIMVLLRGLLSFEPSFLTRKAR